MKTFYTLISLTILILFFYAYLLPYKEKKSYTDNELRETALSRNMSSVPSRYKDLLKLVDSPQNRLSKEKIALGKDLYFDTILSKDRDISCATCHLLSKNQNDKNIFSKALSSKPESSTDCAVCHIRDQSGTDRLSTAVGHKGKENQFHLNTLSTLNAALAKYQTWSGDVATVEDQAGASIQDPFKMSLSSTEVEKRLKVDSDYAKKFNLVFKELTFENVQKAIGAYLRTLLTRSDYDRFLDGDNNAMSETAKKGLANFINFGCKGCHTGITVGGQSIQKFPLRDYNSIIDVTNSFKENDTGRKVSGFNFNAKMYHLYPFNDEGGFMGKNGQKLFRVPMLRNVTKTSPYFHNGSVVKIREAVFIMAKHQLGMSLTNNQADEIVAFLKSLEGDIVDYKVLQKGKL